MNAPELVQILPPTADREEWLNVRRTGLGGTDIAALLGVNPYRTRLGVYLDKTSLEELDDVDSDEEGGDDSPSEAAYWGTVFEAPVAEHFARTNELALVKPGMWARGVEGDRWQLANPDRLIYADAIEAHRTTWLRTGPAVPASVTDVAAAVALYEGKTASAYLSDEWKDGLVPDHYVVQVQWYLHVMGLERAHIAALLGGQRYVQTLVERDQQVIDGLVQIGSRFWHENVLAGVPPELAGEPTKAALALLDQLYPVSIEGERVDLDADFAEVLMQFEAHKALARQHTKAADALKVVIRERLGTAEVGYVDGELAVRSTNVAPSSYTVDRKGYRKIKVEKSFKSPREIEATGS